MVWLKGEGRPLSVSFDIAFDIVRFIERNLEERARI